MNRDALNQWVIGQMNDRRISMRELGRLAGVDHSVVSKVLNGKQNAGLDFYVKIARAFGAVPEMLQVAGVLSTEEDLNISLLELFRVISSLDPEEQAEVEKFVDYLTNRGAPRRKNDLATGDV